MCKGSSSSRLFLSWVNVHARAEACMHEAVYQSLQRREFGRIMVVGDLNEGYYPDPEEVEVTRPKAKRVSSSSPVTQSQDPWNSAAILTDNNPSPSWKELPASGKVKSVLLVVVKLTVVLGLLYLFVCSLDFLSTSFRLIAGKTTGAVFKNQFINNPIVGLMIGIMVTVLVQSSSTSTSIIVSLVNAEILKVSAAVPMIMGSNVGTSVTNTIVSLTQVGDRDVFRRAFAGATVHDMFNWLSVFVLLTIEIITGMLEKLTGLMVDSIDWSKVARGDVKLLKVITEPLTKKIIQIDKKVLQGWARDIPKYENSSLIKTMCKKDESGNGIPGSCDFAFANTNMSDRVVGLILLLSSLVVLCVALIFIVKILSSMMKGNVAQVIRITLNADIPYVPWLTGYIALLVGALMTVLVQSSSIFTSTLTPLIGLGLITLERSYPLTLGSNIGTTTTALLAAVAGSGDGIKKSIQIALVHLFFNIIGILIFYPIPFMRWPIPLAKGLGNITARYRWFAVLYLVFTFLLLPGFVFVLSLGGQIALYCVGIPIIVLIIIIVLINIMQNKIPNSLPTFIRNWNFLPLPLRSLEPYDKIFTRLPCCKSCRNDTSQPLPVMQVNSSSMSPKKSTHGDVLVEPRMFHSVGPNQNLVTKPATKDNTPKSPQFDGIINKGLEVERL
ncbi:Sodium-dependent phosphate transport protein [Trinorchestia longiramus]|nr:Sodium-dependent phosphate transport protein [Trinorchestia longiramus]